MTPEEQGQIDRLADRLDDFMANHWPPVHSRLGHLEASQAVLMKLILAVLAAQGGILGGVMVTLWRAS